MIKQDWLIRTLKTFVETFFSVLIPAVALLIANGFPENWSAWWVALAPTICAGLSAAITAAWNIVLEKMKAE